jgi:hypothetical protein
MGPGGPRRPGQADQAAQRGLPGEVPERDDQARGEVLRRSQHDAQAGCVRPQGSRRGAGQPGPAGHGPARQGRPAHAAGRLRGCVRLGRPLLEGAARPQPLLRRRQGVRVRQPLRPLADGRDRRRLLQQGQGRADAEDLLRVRAAARGGQGRGRRPDRVRQPRSVRGHPRVPDGPEPVRGQGADPRLRLRPRGRELHVAGEPGGRGQDPGVGGQGLLHAGLQRHGLRPGVAAVRQGQGPLPDRGHVAHRRPRRQYGRQGRLHAHAGPGGGRRARLAGR